MPPALYRAMAAAVLLAIPALERQAGEGALAAALVALAVMFAIGSYLVYRSEAQTSWPIPASDALAMIVIVPVALVASSMAQSTVQFGGGWGPNLAAVVAACCAGGIVLIGAAVATSMAEVSPESAPLAFLAGPLMLVVVVLGAGRFGGQDAALGLSAAMMTAALATTASGVVAAHIRPWVPIIASLVFIIVVALLARSAANLSTAATTISLFATAIAAASLLAVSAVASWLDRHRRRRIRPAVD
ncbi:MAG: hypothetical protein M9890_05375 [Thermomicrobiales bacterium]|nr:hypothetical protein [Thermomicrobiales bacterium]